MITGALVVAAEVKSSTGVHVAGRIETVAEIESGGTAVRRYRGVEQSIGVVKLRIKSS
jgi:hypothetical protein